MVLASGWAWHPLSNTLEVGVASRQVFFHIKISKLKGGWEVLLKSGPESLQVSTQLLCC